jgi:hypothetical protein
VGLHHHPQLDFFSPGARLVKVHADNISSKWNPPSPNPGRYNALYYLDSFPNLVAAPTGHPNGYSNFPTLRLSMSSSPTCSSTLPIVFLDPDSDEAADLLTQAMQSLPQGALMLGLILKIERLPDGNERLINWEYAAPEVLKSLALVLPGETSQPLKE